MIVSMHMNWKTTCKTQKNIILTSVICPQKRYQSTFLRNLIPCKLPLRKHKKGGYLGLIGIDRPISHVESDAILDGD